MTDLDFFFIHCLKRKN